MKAIIYFFKKNKLEILVFIFILLPIVVTYFYGISMGIDYAVIVLIMFFFAIVFTVFPRKKQPFFYNRTGKFEVFDIVYDRGSATRPAVPGILKHDGESWFMVYSDGFEWPLSDFRNIEVFTDKKSK